MKRPRASAIALATMLILPASGCRDGDDVPAGPARYQAPGIAFDHPGEWMPLEDLEAAAGVGDQGTQIAVGRLDPDTGNMRGIAIQISQLDITVPEDRSRDFLEEAFDPVVAELESRSGGSILETGWATLDGRYARRYLIRAPARDQVLTTEMLAVVDRDRLFVVACQAPVAEFETVAAGCTMATGSMTIGE